MAKLEKIRQVLEKARNQAQTELTNINKAIKDLNLDAELADVKTFLNEVLTASALKVEKLGNLPLLDTATAGKITLQGRSDILVFLLNTTGASNFSAPKTEFTLVFTEPTDGQLDLDATIVLPKGVAAKFGFLPTFNLTSPTQDVVMNLTKTGNSFSLNMAGKDKLPVQLPGIAAVANLTEGEALANLIPASLLDALKGIAFNKLEATFNPKEKSVSHIGLDLQYMFDADTSGAWQMAPGVQIGSLRFRLDVNNVIKPPPGNTRSAAAMVSGSLQIGNTPIPLELSTANAGAEFWTIRVPEDKTVVLPTLGGLLNAVLDAATAAAIPAQIIDIPGITINTLVLEFDPRKKTDPQEKTVKNLHVDVSLSSDWVLAPGFLSTQDNRLDFTFQNLLDSATRKIFGTATSSLVVSGVPFVFSLEKKADDEQWTMSGSLADGRSLPLSAIISRFLSGFNAPARIPDFSIDEAGFSLEMKTKRVTFHATSQDGLEIIPGFALEKLGIDIDHTPAPAPGGQATTAAELTGTLRVAGIDLNLRATLQKSTNTATALTFQTTAATEQDIPIGSLINSLANFGGIEVPASIAGATISNLTATYQPGVELSFGFDVSLQTDAREVNINVLLRMTKSGNVWNKVFEGLVTAGSLEFEVTFSQNPLEQSFIAALRPGEPGELSLDDLLLHFVDDPDHLIPSVQVSLREAFVSYTKPANQPKGILVFGVSVGAGMTFSDLPLVGPMLNGQSIGVDSVLVTYATAALSLPDIKKLNLNLPKGKPRLPKTGDGNANLPALPAIKLPEIDLKSGVGMSFLMAFGKLKQYLSLPVTEQPAPAGPGAPPPRPVKPAAEGKWFAVNKRIGPLSIARVGVNLKSSVITFGLDASVAVGPLTLLLEEMTFGSSLDKFDPVFGLRGFGLEYSTGPVAISGFFIRKPNEEYFGAALIKTSQLTLKAVGAYAMTARGPSFYLYAYLNYPIGGPAFFFVEGLAAGFGFNRSVRTPAIEDVKNFPLVAIAVGSELFLTVAERMADGNFVPIDPGKIFLAVGVRFTTFKQLDSFLLIIATFGDSFRLDLLGLSKLVIPTPIPGAAPKTPLAEIELAIKGTFAPAEGFVGVQAQLTQNSYILSRDCTLTGGFAFFTWFEGSKFEGDFVITLGGYHPDFKRPGHYPVVPRLGFNWNISSEINIKGGMYFALTPSCVMAGGRLEATFSSGGLKAWFIIGADFIIGWKPYFYDARLYLSMGVSYTFWFFGKQTISFDIGAALHIWGPEFSGTAYVDLGIVDFTVEFGSGASQEVKPIDYDEFKKTFLPSANVAGVSVAAGLLKEIKQGTETVWVVNPKEFQLGTDSIIPAGSVGHNDNAVPAAGAFGIGTMGLAKNAVQTLHKVVIKKGGDDFTNEFIYEAATKSYPAALWGDKLTPDKNDSNRVIKNLISGVRIKPKPPADPDQMGFLDQDEFEFQTLTIPGAFAMENGPAFSKESGAAVLAPKQNPLRNQLLGSLGFDPVADFETAGETDFGFAENPLVGSY